MPPPYQMTMQNSFGFFSLLRYREYEIQAVLDLVDKAIPPTCEPNQCFRSRLLNFDALPVFSTERCRSVLDVHIAALMPELTDFSPINRVPHSQLYFIEICLNIGRLNRRRKMRYGAVHVQCSPVARSIPWSGLFAFDFVWRSCALCTRPNGVRRQHVRCD